MEDKKDRIAAEETGAHKVPQEVPEKNIVLRIFGNIEKYICVFTILAVSVIVFCQVVGRVFFNYSLSWSEEVGRLLLVWITFGGSAYAFRQGAHIGVTYFFDKLPPKWKKAGYIVLQLVSVAFFALLTYYGTMFTLNQVAHGQLLAATRMSVAWAYSAIPVGSVLVIIRLVIDTIENVGNKDWGCE